MNVSLIPQQAHERAGAVAGAATAITAPLLGPHGLELIGWVLVAMGFDLLAGLVKALIRENLDWSIFMRGVLKKILMLMIVFPAAMADRLVNLSGVVSSDAGPIVFAVLVAVCMYEGASITRNIKNVYGEAQFVMVVQRFWDNVRYASKHGRPAPTDRSYDPGDDPDA